MKNSTKADIDQFLQSLNNSSWLGDYRKNWPQFLYHTTTLENALNIMSKGCIKSRDLAISDGDLLFDIADDSVIDNTDAEWKSYARLYMRPKTPTLYNTEGIRPVSKIYDNAHCPVPVVFMLNASKILNRDDTKFSNGNLAKSRAVVSDDFNDYKKLPFSDIYHYGSFSQAMRDQIIFHRHAEVVVPDKIDLNDNLVSIKCRSHAETRTLRHLVYQNNNGNLANQIGTVKSFNLFHEDWHFIKEVSHDDEYIYIRFNKVCPTKPAGPFHVKFLIENISGDFLGELDYPEKSLKDYGENLRVGRKRFAGQSLIFTCSINGIIAFKDILYDFKDIPF